MIRRPYKTGASLAGAIRSDVQDRATLRFCTKDNRIQRGLRHKNKQWFNSGQMDG
jgi:hypothetical protein